MSEARSILDDKMAIRELTARYNFAIDEGPASAFAETFTEDGVFAPTGAPPASGRSELITAAEQWMSTARSRHMTTEAVIEVDGDRAHQRCYLLMMFYGEAARPPVTAVYEDDLVRTPGGWRLARRAVTLDAATD